MGFFKKPLESGQRFYITYDMLLKHKWIPYNQLININRKNLNNKLITYIFLFFKSHFYIIFIIVHVNYQVYSFYWFFCSFERFYCIFDRNNRIISKIFFHFNNSFNHYFPLYFNYNKWKPWFKYQQQMQKNSY